MSTIPSVTIRGKKITLEQAGNAGLNFRKNLASVIGGSLASPLPIIDPQAVDELDTHARIQEIGPSPLFGKFGKLGKEIGKTVLGALFPVSSRPVGLSIDTARNAK